VGEGKQTRSFLNIDERLKAMRCFKVTDFLRSAIIGSREMVNIIQLAKIVIILIGMNTSLKHIPKYQGARERISDKTLIREKMG